MKRNEYNTKSKKNIIEFLEKNINTTVTVMDIKKYFDSINLKIDLTTIYRYLDKLVDENIVIKYTSGKGRNSNYQYLGDKANCIDHIHIQCIKCGQILHLDCEYMEDLSNHINLKHGFNIAYNKSILYGKCSKCRKI